MTGESTKEEVKAFKEAFMSKFRPASEFRMKYNLDKEPLGAGHFSKVYKAHSFKNPSDEYAVKMINMNKLEDMAEVRALDNEIQILQAVSHPGIVRLFDVYSNGDEVWLVLEFLDGGELFQRIIQRSEGGLYTEQEAAKIVRHILEVLKYLHELNIVHRDLKPENILLRDKTSDTRLKLADFGFAAYCFEPLDDPYGTPVYVAPEVLVGEPYTTTPDMWSVGVITYILLCGYPPFFNNDQETLARMIVRTGFKFLPEDWDVVSDDAKNFIRGLLRKNPKKRMTAAQALETTWIKNYSYNVTSMNVKNYLTVNEELKKFRATTNLMKAFGVIRAFEKMKKLADLAGKMKGLEIAEDKDSDDEVKRKLSSQNHRDKKKSSLNMMGKALEDIGDKVKKASFQVKKKPSFQK